MNREGLAPRAATRIGPVALGRLASGVRGRVHSVFDRSVNLECGGRLVAMLGPDLGMHPFAVKLGGGLPPLERGEGFTADVEGLRFSGGQTVRLAGAAREVFRPRPAVLSPAIAGRAVRDAWPLLERSALRGVFGPAGEGSSDVGVDDARKFLAAFASGDSASALKSGTNVLGLGPGLTPAFDDFLVGAAAALAYLPKARAARGRRVMVGLAARAENLTTRVSREFLASAACNMFSEPVLAVLDALPRPDDGHGRRAMLMLARMGHTSGADCLAGLLAAAFAFAKMPRNERK